MFKIKSFQNRAFQIGVVSLVLLSGQAAHAATFTVTNTNNDETGSLREAIVEANVTADVDTINFNIPGEGVQTIRPASALPIITAPLRIDGATQPGYGEKPLVELDGSNVAVGNGLTLVTGNSTVKSLIINRFTTGDGITIQTAGGNRVESCYIGTDAGGVQALGNGRGIRLAEASNNVISGNVVSGNRGNGVEIVNTTEFERGGNEVSGNLIGTDAPGTRVLGNGAAGVLVRESPKNLIGYTCDYYESCTGARNIIAGNGGNGVEIFGSRAMGNTVVGNYIGTNAQSQEALPNGVNGIRITDAPSTRLGVTFAAFGRHGLGNVICGNRSNGILISGATASGTFIVANSIGVAAQLGTDTYPLGRVLGNGGDGIEINRAANTAIGIARTEPERGSVFNTIGGNEDCGVRITDDRPSGLATGNVLLQNYIGTDAAGRNLANANDGVRIINGFNTQIGAVRPSNNFVTDVNSLNVIAHNGGNGVLVVSGRNNTIRFNSIYNNGRLGIDLDARGQTPNDVRDADSGPNDLLNFPEVMSAEVSSSSTTYPTAIVKLRYRGLPDAGATLQVFASAAPDDSGFGQGQRYIGESPIKADANGEAVVAVAINTRLGEFITATATVAGVGTSEFSRAVKVLLDATAPTITITSPTNGATLSTFPRIEGTYGDNRRVERIEVFIQRRSDKKYFDGTDWVVIAPRFRAEARNLRLWRYNGVLPAGAQLRTDTYQILAIAFDASGNRGQAVSTIRIVSGGTTSL